MIYWDGKPVASDRGGGRTGKTGAFSIGASTVFGGRFFKGGVEDVGFWNRALKATEPRVAPDGSHIDRLKFDPRMDPNYTYTLATSGISWEAHATAKKRDLLGFYFVVRTFPQTIATYNPSGTSSVIDKELTGRSIEGDSFATHCSVRPYPRLSGNSPRNRERKRVGRCFRWEKIVRKRGVGRNRLPHL